MLDNNMAIFLTITLITIVIIAVSCVGHRWIRAQSAIMRRAKLAERQYRERMAADHGNAAASDADSITASTAAHTSVV